MCLSLSYLPWLGGEPHKLLGQLKKHLQVLCMVKLQGYHRAESAPTVCDSVFPSSSQVSPLLVFLTSSSRLCALTNSHFTFLSGGLCPSALPRWTRLSPGSQGLRLGSLGCCGPTDVSLPQAGHRTHHPPTPSHTVLPHLTVFLYT